MANGIFGSIIFFITNSIGRIGYPAIFALMFLESALIPIPSEVTMPFAGFLVGRGLLSFWPVVFVGASANLIGSLAAYGLGFWGQERFVRKLIKKYGRYLLITYGEVEKAEKRFREKGELIAFGSRLLPVVRTFISLPAGFSQMNIIKFSLFTFAGAFIWSAGLAYFGLVLGENWRELEGYFRKFDLLFVFLFAAAAVIYVRHKLKKIKAEEKSE